MPTPLAPEHITHLIVHCSDSAWGDLRVIDSWHRQRGFDHAGGLFVGYHFLVLNGFPSYGILKDGHRATEQDGMVVVARPATYWGCHALGFNQRSLGVCLIGMGASTFTPGQITSARRLLRELMASYHVPPEHVLGHCETPLANGKTCPAMDMAHFRAHLFDP